MNNPAKRKKNMAREFSYIMIVNFDEKLLIMNLRPSTVSFFKLFIFQALLYWFLDGVHCIHYFRL